MGATFARIKVWITGEVLTAAALNAEFDNVLNNLGPAGIDDLSANATAMQGTADPFPGGSESLATSLAGELQRLRYLVQQGHGSTQWYIFPDLVTVTNADTPVTVTAANRIILCDCTAGVIELDFPAASGITDKFFYIKKIDSSGNAVTIDPNASETIDGAASLAVSNENDAYAITSNGSNLHIISKSSAGASSELPKGYRGLVQGIAIDAGDTEHDIEFQIQEVRDATDADDIALASLLTKRMDGAWVVGDNNGGFPDGEISLSGDTIYYAFLIKDAGSGTVDAGFDSALDASNLLIESGYDYYRRVGTVHTDGSNNIRNGIWAGKTFRYDTPPFDVNVSNQGTSWVARPLTAPPGCEVFGYVEVAKAGATPLISIRPGDSSDASSASYTARASITSYAGVSQWWAITDASSQIDTAASVASTNLKLYTAGWIEHFND